jgi:hypothetical protein
MKSHSRNKNKLIANRKKVIKYLWTNKNVEDIPKENNKILLKDVIENLNREILHGPVYKIFLLGLSLYPIQNTFDSWEKVKLSTLIGNW